MIRRGASCHVRASSTALTSVAALALILATAPSRAEERDLASGDPVLIWNEQTNRAIQEAATDPVLASRALALESIAVLDTVRSIASAPAFLVRLPGPPDLRPNIAVAAAAHAMLGHLFPARRTVLDATLNASLADEPAGPARDRALAFGKATADAVFAIRDRDGWSVVAGFVASTKPGQPRPSQPSTSPSPDQQWAAVTPFVLTRPGQFRPPGPPAPGTTALRDATATVASMGGDGSTERTDAQTQVARYWSDANGTAAPTGHWNAIAANLLAALGLGMEAEAELFAQLNVAIADAGIAAVDAKYAYRFSRPVTAIREGTAGAPPNPDWSPLLGTPGQPSYISGYAGFSGAAAAILTARFGAGEFSYTSPGLPGVTRTFTSFQQAAEEAAASRVYGGTHYPFDTADGLATGRSIGAWTLAAFRRIAEDRGPVIVMDGSAGPGRQRTQAPMGFALDNFSPVKTVTVRLDGGERFNVAVDDRGRFTLPRQRLEAIGFREAVLVATSGTGRAAVARLQTGGIGDGNAITAPFTVK